MTIFLSQTDYLTYFNAVQETTTVLIHGIENVSLDKDTFIPLNRFSAFHLKILALGRLIGAAFSKKNRVNRQKETDQKLARLAASIATINSYNRKFISQVNLKDRAESLVSSKYYTLRAAKLHNEAFALMEAWNKRLTEDPQAKKPFLKRIKRAYSKFVGLEITNQVKNLSITTSDDGKLSKSEISMIALGKMSSFSFLKICQQYKGFRGGKRGIDPINHTRLQLMGGFTENAESQAKKIIKDEKPGDTAKEALENAALTAGDAMALEDYMETIVLNTFRGAHDQLEISEGILHFDTTIGKALVENFKKVESFDLLFPLLQSAKHHFCHNQTTTLQAIQTLIAHILKPYALKNSDKISEETLKSWLDKAIKLFPEEQNWIKGVFFEEIIRSLAIKEKAKKENWLKFSVQHLLCDNLTETYVKRKLEKIKLN